MVERPGERVAARRLDQGNGLAPQSAVSGSEDQVQDDRHDQRGRQGEDDDLLARRPDPGEHRFRVARDREDGVDDTVGRDRERRREHLGRCPVRGSPAGPMLAEVEPAAARAKSGDAVPAGARRSLANRSAPVGVRTSIRSDVAAAHDDRQLGLKCGRRGRAGSGRIRDPPARACR